LSELDRDRNSLETSEEPTTQIEPASSDRGAVGLFGIDSDVDDDAARIVRTAKRAGIDLDVDEIDPDAAMRNANLNGDEVEGVTAYNPYAAIVSDDGMNEERERREFEQLVVEERRRLDELGIDYDKSTYDDVIDSDASSLIAMVDESPKRKVFDPEKKRSYIRHGTDDAEVYFANLQEQARKRTPFDDDEEDEEDPFRDDELERAMAQVEGFSLENYDDDGSDDDFADELDRVGSTATAKGSSNMDDRAATNPAAKAYVETGFIDENVHLDDEEIALLPKKPGPGNQGGKKKKRRKPPPMYRPWGK